MGDEMNIVDMARTSGLVVILDGRIGREEYQSVCGSLSALQRFAEAVREGEANQRDVDIDAARMRGRRRALL
jgi:hypothetical protein